MMTTRSDVSDYLFYDGIFSTWDALPDAHKDEYINRAESDINQTYAFIGKKESVSQTDPFPRDLEDIVDWIDANMSHLPDYLDIKQSYDDVDATTPQRVKNAIAEQVKHILLTEDFEMEQKELEVFEGTTNTNKSTFTGLKHRRVCLESQKLLDPFIIKPTAVFYAF
jgi:hypothetical protein